MIQQGVNQSATGTVLVSGEAVPLLDVLLEALEARGEAVPDALRASAVQAAVGPTRADVPRWAPAQPSCTLPATLCGAGEAPDAHACVCEEVCALCGASACGACACHPPSHIVNQIKTFPNQAILAPLQRVADAATTHCCPRPRPRALLRRFFLGFYF